MTRQELTIHYSPESHNRETETTEYAVYNKAWNDYYFTDDKQVAIAKWKEFNADELRPGQNYPLFHKVFIDTLRAL